MLQPPSQPQPTGPSPTKPGGHPLILHAHDCYSPHSVRRTTSHTVTVTAAAPSFPSSSSPLSNVTPWAQLQPTLSRRLPYMTSCGLRLQIVLVYPDAYPSFHAPPRAPFHHTMSPFSPAPAASGLLPVLRLPPGRLLAPRPAASPGPRPAPCRAPAPYG